jgi:hypothetical protein
MPGAATPLPVDGWAEQCERCRPAARALRLQLEEARERIVDLQSQVGQLKLEVGVLRSQHPPTRGSSQSVSSPSRVNGVKGKMHGIMVPYRGLSSGAPYSERERGGLPFSSVSSTASKNSYAPGRMSKAPPSIQAHVPPEGPAAVFARLLTKEFWTGQEDPQQRAVRAATLVQARLRGWRQRARFRAAREVFAVVSGTSTFASSTSRRSVATYVITVVRAGCCWQVGRATTHSATLLKLLAHPHQPRWGDPLSHRSRLPRQAIRLRAQRAVHRRSTHTSHPSLPIFRLSPLLLLAAAWSRPLSAPLPRLPTPTLPPTPFLPPLPLPPRQVEHRYSDWRRLNELLSKTTHAPTDPPLPPFPSRLPFGGATVESHRQFVRGHASCPSTLAAVLHQRQSANHPTQTTQRHANMLATTQTS